MDLCEGEALEEAEHPIHGCFIGLAGVARMLVARATLPYSHPAALVLLFLGTAFSILFATWRTGIMWCGGRDHEAGADDSHFGNDLAHAVPRPGYRKVRRRGWARGHRAPTLSLPYFAR